MNITFYRRGFACNSSSSHSLIWMSKLPHNTEELEFGWQNFTCSDPEAKKNYLASCLYTSWNRVVQLSCQYDSHIDYRELRSFAYASFLSWIRLEFPYLAMAVERTHEPGSEFSSYVDHQSEIAFPCYRRFRKLNLEFLRMFVPQVVEQNFVILGGNDNRDPGKGEHPLRNKDVANEGETVKLLYRELRDKDSSQVMAELDEKTGEFVISIARTGSIMRVKP